MLYLIYAQDIENSLQLRQKVRPAHVQRLQDLKNQGRLIIAGPCPAADTQDPGPAGFSGSMIVAEFESLESAKNWANLDPYIEAGVYKDVTVKPYLKVLP